MHTVVCFGNSANGGNGCVARLLAYGLDEFEEFVRLEEDVDVLTIDTHTGGELLALDAEGYNLLLFVELPSATHLLLGKGGGNGAILLECEGKSPLLDAYFGEENSCPNKKIVELLATKKK